MRRQKKARHVLAMMEAGEPGANGLGNDLVGRPRRARMFHMEHDRRGAWRASGRSSRSSGPASKSATARRMLDCCSSASGILPMIAASIPTSQSSSRPTFSPSTISPANRFPDGSENCSGSDYCGELRARGVSILLSLAGNPTRRSTARKRNSPIRTPRISPNNSTRARRMLSECSRLSRSRSRREWKGREQQVARGRARQRRRPGEWS